jgi:drug/metabolite transporter (DMT)-like permease
VLFGLTALLVRVATRAPGMSATQTSLVRFLVGLVGVLALFTARPATFAPRNYRLLTARAAFGGASALLYFKGLALIPAGEATLLNNTFPLWGVLLSFAVLRERPSVHVGLALMVAASGVFLVLGGTHDSLRLGTGECLALASGVCGGAAVTAIRALRKDHPAATVFFAFTLGGLAASAPAVLEPWHFSAGTWLAAALVGITAFLAQMAMTQAYSALAVAEAAVWQQLTPIASFAWALTVDEHVTVATGVGVALGVTGVAYGSAFGRSRGAPHRRADGGGAASG